MTVSIDALLVFCEGPHDVAYVRMALRKQLSFKKVEVPFRELPSPFHKLFKQSISTHTAKDLSLDMAHKFFLPDTILRKENSLILLYNCGGKYQYENIRQLLADYLPIFPQSRTFAEGTPEIVDNIKYLFLYDADSEGIDAIVNNVTREFGTIEGSPFIDQEWGDSKQTAFGKIAADKAVYVWGSSPESGTLEDILIPIFTQDQSDLISKAELAIDNIFTWETDHADEVRVVAEIEKRNKSILTLAGQRNKPGSSMNVILEQSKLLSESTIKGNPQTIEFISFVEEFVGFSV